MPTKYERTNWYGVNYLCTLTASVLPRSLPMVIWAMAIAGTFSGIEWSPSLREYFGHPYAAQLLGLVFGYLSVARLNVSYSRYWEGITHVKVMYSKWADACLQTLAFDSVPRTMSRLADDPFCAYTVRLFSQLSAMAMFNLHQDGEDWDAVQTMLTTPPAANPDLGREGLLTQREKEMLQRAPDP